MVEHGRTRPFGRFDGARHELPEAGNLSSLPQPDAKEFLIESPTMACLSPNVHGYKI